MPKTKIKMNAATNDIQEALEQEGYTVSFGEGWVNIQRPDGVNCEFYDCVGDFSFLSATYEIQGEEQELDFSIPEDLNAFVEAVKEILDV